MAKKNDENFGVLHIYATFNNTVATLTDLAGNTIGKTSGGQITKHDRMKANPTIAMFIAKRVNDLCRDYKIKNLYVKIRGQTGATGVGPGANAIVKTLTKEGFKILNITDVTRIARGGPKKERRSKGT